MRIIMAPAIVANILIIILLSIGLFYNFEKPKNKAIYGYSIAGSMLMYIIILGLLAIYELIANHNLYSIILFLCVVSPFIIGKFVKYETLKKYTLIQIICFTVSLVTIYLKF